MKLTLALLTAVLRLTTRTMIVTFVLSALAILTGFAQSSADVIVYGSTPGGFCAAIAAAREGASVILLEPTAHVGGLSTGGLSHCDSNQMRRTTLMGLFDEWHTRIVKDYTDRGLPAPYDPKLKNQALWTFEPHVAMRVTMQMLKESGVTVMTEQYLASVKRNGTRITSLVTKKGEFTAKVFVDGSYEGDLMAAAGVDWTIGREGRAEFGESYAGKQYPKGMMNISGFDEEGNLLPLVTTRDAGPDEAADTNVMTYSFRLCLTKDPANKEPMPQPANYDPARFELARRALKVGARVGFDLYPLPGNKLDGNNSIGGQISFGLIGAGNNWHRADEAGRQKIWEDHKQYTLEFIHFLRNDPAVPKNVRDKFADLGLCKDEFADTDHFSPALYVRESRRMKGMYIISQKDIIDSPEKDDPIAISSFPIDSHDCQRVALKGGGVINEGTIMPVRVKGTGVGYAYHVPYRAILPKPEQCTNLLVPVALSCTHVAISSLRIEGAWMVIGHGAGIAAALAAKLGVAVQDLPYPVLRGRLRAQGQVLDLPGRSASPKPAAGASVPVNSLVGIVLDDATADHEELVAETHQASLKLREEALRKTIAKDTAWPQGIWGDNRWVLSALYLNEKVDEANARLLKQANAYIDMARKRGSAPVPTPEQPGNAPWNFFSITDYVRTLCLFHSKNFNKATDKSHLLLHAGDVASHDRVARRRRDLLARDSNRQSIHPKVI